MKFNEKLDKKALKALNEVCRERNKHFYASHREWIRIAKQFEKVAKQFDRAGDEYFAKSMRVEFRSCMRRAKKW